MAVSGDTIVVGAPYYSEDLETSMGAVYVYEKDGAAWPATESQKLTAGDGDAGDQFGYSVAFDGSSIVVGARGDNDGGSNAGAAYIFNKPGTSWTQTEKLLAWDGSTNLAFGTSVAIDGTTLVVGADCLDASDKAGRAYVFVQTPAGWEGRDRLVGLSGNEYFGRAVDVGSGGVFLVGAPGADLPETDAGMAHLFETTSDMAVVETARITQPPAPEDCAEFGSSVALDGKRIVVGAWAADRDGCSACGAVFVYTGLNLLFSDGFEGGNTSAWSSTAPLP